MSLHDGAGCIKDPAGNVLGNDSPTAQHIVLICANFQSYPKSYIDCWFLSVDGSLLWLIHKMS